MLGRGLVFSLLFGCASTSPTGDGVSGDGSTAESGSDGSTDVTADSWTGGPPDEPTTGEQALDCDPWLQDCAEGDKCTHYNTMGLDTHVDATECVPVPPMPVPTGGICKATGGFGAGDDDCGRGEFCYFLGGDEIGVCVPLCGGSLAHPLCPEGSHCSQGFGAALYMCLPECDAFAQDCLEGANCTPNAYGFVCALDTSGEEGQIYDGCDAANGCDPGLMCAPPGSAPDCAGGSDGCCLPLCAIDGTPCPDSLECLALYDPEAQPELALAGVCATPP